LAENALSANCIQGQLMIVLGSKIKILRPLSVRFNIVPYILYMHRSLPSMAPRHTVHTRTAILGSLRYTTAMDGGSAGNAGSNYLPVHPVHTRTAILGSLRYTVHPVHKKGGHVNRVHMP
jgi:hypothetical protein